MGSSDLRAVAGHADALDQTLFASLDGGINRATWAERSVPLDRVGQIVQLPQIDVVDLHMLERTVQLFARLLCAAFAGLGGQEEFARVALEPGRNAQLRIA